MAVITANRLYAIFLLLPAMLHFNMGTKPLELWFSTEQVRGVLSEQQGRKVNIT